MHQTRHSLCVIVIIRKATNLIIIFIMGHVHYVGRKVILRHISRRIKPHATSHNVFRVMMERILPQCNEKIKGTWRKRECQVVNAVPRIFVTIAS
jgi:hypothetical protein